MSPVGTRSGVSEGRCEQSRDRPRADVRGRIDPVRSDHRLGHRADDEPAQSVARARRGAHPTTVVVFVRNSAIGNLMLCALAAWLLFPVRRPKAPRRDWAIIVTIAVMVLTSLYQLFWLRSLVQ